MDQANDIVRWQIVPPIDLGAYSLETFLALLLQHMTRVLRSGLLSSPIDSTTIMILYMNILSPG